MARIRRNRNTTSANANKYFSRRTTYQIPGYSKLNKSKVTRVVSNRFP